jgi:RimJ/RimL family protein N-acetyltransferase
MTLNVPSPYSEADALDWIAMAEDGRKNGTRDIYAIHDLHTAGLMGGIEVYLNGQYGYAELGYWMGKPYRRRGFTRDAVRAVIGGMFDYTGVVRIQATHKVGNDASGRVLLANGMRKEVVLEGYAVKGDRVHSVVQYRLLRREWEAGQAK